MPTAAIPAPALLNDARAETGPGTAAACALPEVPALPASTILPTKPAAAPRLETPVEAPAPLMDLEDSALTQAVLLNWLGQQQVVFHRLYVDITGAVLPALWLSHVLSQLQSVHLQSPAAVDAAGDFVFAPDQALCEAQTGLSASEQKKCLSTLESVGLVVVDRARAPRRLRLRLQRLAELMVEHSAPLSAAIQASGTDAMNLDLLEARSRARRNKRRGKAA